MTNIKEFGIIIVMDEEKIIKDNKYELEEIYNKIDHMAYLSRMKKVDKYNYISENDSPSELGCFVFNNLEECNWFLDYVKEWIWLDKEDGIINVFDYIDNKNEKIS